MHGSRYRLAVSEEEADTIGAIIQNHIGVTSTIGCSHSGTSTSHEVVVCHSGSTSHHRDVFGSTIFLYIGSR
jgi:hypothetical protein